MPNPNRRETDKPVRKYSTLIHYVSGMFIGWMMKVYFPEKNALEMFGEVWEYIVNTIQTLGGLSAIASLIIAGFTVYRWTKDKKNGR